MKLFYRKHNPRCEVTTAVRLANSFAYSTICYSHKTVTDTSRHYGIPGGTLRGDGKTARGELRGATSEGKTATGKVRGATCEGDKREARARSEERAGPAGCVWP